jgi:beta-N-acetylhexosaminidase
MTLDQELGQLFIVEYLYGDSQHADLQAMIGDLGAGGVILYQSLNMYSVPQMQQLTQAMQSAARIPLILGADEEGGGDDQTDQIFGSHPTAWDIGSTGNSAVAAQNATRLASELKQLGMNADFAPVVDVLAPGRVWSRSFSHSPALVAKMGIAQVDAMQAAGVMACPKHFPGLGAATINPHAGLPVINNSRSYIEEHDLAPYRALIDHQPAMIMTTDLLMLALDRTMPAELSQPIVTGILRNEIGYNGVVVTDALYMGGITDRFSMPEAGVLAIQAGNDMLEGAWNADQMRAMVDALRAAVHSGRLTKARIDESVRRILMLKLTYGLMRPLSLHNTLASASGAPAVKGDDDRVAGERPEWLRALV